MPGSEAEAPELPGELKYLELVHDFENRVDRGPLSGKEVLIYSPSKTGTVSLYHGLGLYFQKLEGWKSYVPKLLHNHSNRELIACLDRRPEVSLGWETARCVVSDLIAYKRCKGDRIRIVSSFRDPVHRALSTLYDALHNKLIRDREINTDDVTVDLCQEMINRILIYQNHTKHPLEDVEANFFQKHEFSYLEHYCHSRAEHHEILVLTLEESARWPGIVELVFGQNGAEFQPRNRAEDKEIARHCHPFIKQVRLSRNIIDQVYYSGNGGKYAAWHYSEAVLEGFYKRALNTFV